MRSPRNVWTRVEVGADLADDYELSGAAQLELTSLTRVPQFALTAKKLYSDGLLLRGNAVSVGARRGAM